MDFRPSSDRALRLRGGEEGSIRLPSSGDRSHDVDGPAWRRPDDPVHPRQRPSRLIDLERRARFARQPVETPGGG